MAEREKIRSSGATPERIIGAGQIERIRHQHQNDSIIGWPGGQVRGAVVRHG